MVDEEQTIRKKECGPRQEPLQTDAGIKHTGYASKHIKPSTPEGTIQERKKELEYIHTYIHTLQQPTTNTYKIHTTLSVDSSVHRAIMFLAPFFETTASDLYVSGALEKLEKLIPQLPESIQVSIMHSINVKQEADPEIAGLKIDIAHEQLAFWIKKLRSVPDNVWVKNNLQRQLTQSMKLAATSGNDPLKQLVHEARELLRGSLH